MKDFRANRDININNSSVTITNPTTGVKPIGLLSIPELFEEREHRERLLRNEEQRRTRHLPKVLLFGCCCVGATWGLQQFSDMSQTFILPISFASALASLGSFGLTVHGYANQTEFELRQLEVLK